MNYLKKISRISRITLIKGIEGGILGGEDLSTHFWSCIRQNIQSSNSRRSTYLHSTQLEKIGHYLYRSQCKLGSFWC